MGFQPLWGLESGNPILKWEQNAWAPRARRIVLFRESVVGGEDQIKPAAHLVNLRRPEAILVRTVLRQGRQIEHALVVENQHRAQHVGAFAPIVR